ncbi:MAG: DUF192 domain-containing protein [Deltaproteobacteria bacterium]|nr:DUF192 domain-containing protein [Deltaproteobacteria bacterium]
MRGWLLLGALGQVSSCRDRAAPERPPIQRPLEDSGSPAPQAPQTPRPLGPRVVLRGPGHAPVTVSVEVARENATCTQGLMYRRELAEDRGMVFLFREQHHLQFWMHNTLVRLDMVFIRQDRTVLGIVKNATPRTDDIREVPGDSRYVLEVRGGFADRHGISPDDVVEFVDIPDPDRPPNCD